MFWNINGCSDLVKSDVVAKWLYMNCDICFLSETHMTKGQIFEIPNFICFNHPSSVIDDKKPRGGMCCLIKDCYLEKIQKVRTDMPDFIVVSLLGGHTVFGNYIPPKDSRYFDEKQFSDFPTLFYTGKEGVVIGGGDLNSRVGDVDQVLPTYYRYRKKNRSGIKFTWKYSQKNLQCI